MKIMIQYINYVIDTEFLIYMIFFSFIEALWNISLFRRRMSWIYITEPIYDQRFIKYDIDQEGFHLLKGLQSIVALWLIWIWKHKEFFEIGINNMFLNGKIYFDWVLALGSIPIIIWIIYYGLGLFTWQYHIVFIKPKYWKTEIYKVFPFTLLKLLNNQ